MRYSGDGSKMIEDIMNIVRKAGDIMSDRENLIVKSKGTRENLATSADYKVERFLKKELTELLPGSSFLGEEDGREGEGRYGWIADPIDGTANYARDLRVSTVSVALTDNGIPVTGLVYQPYTGEMFHAEKGKGAFSGNKKLTVSDRRLENSMFCTSWSAYKKERAEMCFRISERMFPLCEDIRRFGTAAYEMCLLAEGKIDIYYEASLQPWDFAAGALIVREAGGFVGSVNGNEGYGREYPIIASNSKDSFEFLRNTVCEEMENFGEPFV